MFRNLSLSLILLLLLAGSNALSADWIKGKAYKLPTELTNQESGYFSIIEGLNGKLYIGCAKYGVNGYLIEFDPKAEKSTMVMDVMKTIGSDAKGFAAQSKLHTRNNVGASGKIYVGSKQGYPEKGETRDMYLGGYVLTYDPATGKSEHFGIAKEKHGIISVTPDEEMGVAYISTCSDDRPIDHTHFMVLDLKTKKYTDFGDMEHAYAFIVIDDQHRAYHPKRGGTVVRYDPKTKKTEELKISIDGQPVPKELSGDHCIQNWDWTPDHKTMFCVEMTTNKLFMFDLTAKGDVLPGKSLGTLLPEGTKTDCRAMCVGPDGKVWMAVSDRGHPGGSLLHLVSYTPGDKAPKDQGPVGIANPDFTTFTTPDGKPKPWHQAIRKEKDGTLTPWVPMGVCAAKDGTVYIYTISPLTLMKFEQFKK
ncbi:MAG: SMP-30/gluconolactonase/LRE family protein [Planctomycetes bacterium]|nr:SMP-30/gluconolactonase/LRE family protein [Planctomycetota bacterium]